MAFGQELLVIKSYKNFPFQLRNGLGLLADIPSRYDPLM
jgi:hypothetical protein